MFIMSRVPPRWNERSCVGTSLELWFGPEVDGAARPRETAEQKRWRIAKARRLCASCPVRGWCLEQELQLDIVEQHGVRGGLTADDRKQLIRDRRRTAATPAGAASACGGRVAS